MLNNVIGQDRAKQVLELLGHGFNRRGKLPPVGLFGNSGGGKTHLATCWAQELGAKQIYVNGTAVKDALSFRSFLKEARDHPRQHHIIFIDECHRLPKKVQDNLLSVLEEPAVLCTVATKEIGNVRCVDGMRFIDKGDVMREDVPNNVSFVLATTDPAQLKEPVLNRLRRVYLSPYTIEDKIEIAITHLGEQGVRSDITVYEALANRSRSIRHLKGELCETFIDIRTLHGEDDLTSMDTLDDILGIDDDGANDLDRDYLQYLADNSTVGLETMAGKLQIDKQQILSHIEPFLLEKGWMMIASRGRKLTEAGRRKVFGDDYAEPTE